MRRRVAAEAKPNPAHFALAKLEQKLQDRLFLCTQNVDDLHEQAGSIRVVHMHGELFKSRCDRCTRPPFHDTTTYDPPAELPRCDCGGQDSPAHLLVRRSAVRLGSHLRRTGQMHDLHGCRHVGRGRASRELCGARGWSCPNDLRRSRRTRKRIRVHRMPFGESGRGVARPTRSKVCVVARYCSRVGGGALTRWPPSAAQTARAGFLHAAFAKTQRRRDDREGIKSSNRTSS